MSHEPKYPRGSEWREWDLHIHTPASFHWDGERFGADPARNKVLVDEMVAALNEATPAVFAIMDYWTFDGWFELKRRLASQDAPELTKIVFPGIELRLTAPMEGRLNAHVIFSNLINDQYLIDFLSRLRLALINQPLSRNALIEYARYVNEDKLNKHNFKKSEVANDDDIAYEAGCHIAEINCESYKEAIRLVPNGLAVGFMPFSTNDGLQSIKWSEHYAYVLELFEASPIFETRNPDLWAAFAGIETTGNKNWLTNFQAALRGVPRLAVSGSDSHRPRGAQNNKRGYGDFPSGKKTWIKADPTWRGLLQAIKEPAKRSYLGNSPQKLDRLKQNKTYFIESIKVEKTFESSLSDSWLHGCDISLNPDLVAIIGNKGSGKSALADIISLLGHSKQGEHFSFLKKNRFRGKSGEPAKSFKGTLSWHAGEPTVMLLNEDAPPEKVEMVRYIPQSRFETLCNDHVTGRSDAFERELRSVIFSHLNTSERLGALDFDQLVEQQEATFRQKLTNLRSQLHSINEEITRIEEQLHPNIRSNLQEQLQLKQLQHQELLDNPPIEVAPPTDVLSEEQVATRNELARIETELQELQTAREGVAKEKQLAARKRQSILKITQRLTVIEEQFTQAIHELAEEFKFAELTPHNIAAIKIDHSQLQKALEAISTREKDINTEAEEKVALETSLKAKRGELTATLNAHQQTYQKYLEDREYWSLSVTRVLGKEDEPETICGIQARLRQLNDLPESLDRKQSERIQLTRDIFETLDKQRKTRADLFAPLQALIQTSELIRNEYKLQFQANLQGSVESLSNKLFDLVKRTSGALRGEGDSAVREIFEKYQFRDQEGAVEFSKELHKLTIIAAEHAKPGVPGIQCVMKKDRSPTEVYNLIYGLNYLEPKYTLLFQDTSIEQLSPGQRGALLLIFYLLVDRGQNPIVLDQPEENLDNETVVSLLVPVLNEAKKTRQIIMVTHNPNLAVVCDAEQIIHARFERMDGPRISYRSGSIEDPLINRSVVDVLEGTKIAFDNRGQKYH